MITEEVNSLRYQSVASTDFQGAVTETGFAATVSGTGAAAALKTTGTAGHPGVLELTTGTTTTGVSAVAANITDWWLDTTTGEFYLEALVNIPTLSTVGEEYSFGIGFGDTVATHDQVDGAYFYYDRVNDGVNFFAATASNSTRTEVNTNVAVTAATWTRLQISSNGSTVFYYINDTAVATISTNLPATSARAFGRFAVILKSAGTTARTAEIDSFYTKLIPASNR